MAGNTLGIKAHEYDRYDEVFPNGTRVRFETEWKPGKWNDGTVSHHMTNSQGVAQWIFIEADDGFITEFDYRYLDIEDFRNSLVKPVKLNITMTSFDFSFLDEEPDPPLPEGWYMRTMTSLELESEYYLALHQALKEFKVAYAPNQEWTVTFDETDAAKVARYVRQGKERYGQR